MEQIIETDMQGALTLSPELLGDPEPRTRYVVESHLCNIGDSLGAKPEDQDERETLKAIIQKGLIELLHNV